MESNHRPVPGQIIMVKTKAPGGKWHWERGTVLANGFVALDRGFTFGVPAAGSWRPAT